jgi:hypothetical protein
MSNEGKYMVWKHFQVERINDSGPGILEHKNFLVLSFDQFPSKSRDDHLFI